MEKIKILSISKRDYRSEFGFPKEQKLFEILRQFLINLGFDKNKEWGVMSLGRTYDSEKHEYNLNQEDSIDTYSNIINNYTSEDYSVDIIYFDKKVFVILNYKEDKQKEIGEALKDLIIEEEKWKKKKSKM